MSRSASSAVARHASITAMRETTARILREESLAGVEPDGFPGTSLMSGADGPVYAGVWGLPYWADRVDPRFASPRRYVRDGSLSAVMWPDDSVVLRRDGAVVDEPAEAARLRALLAPTFTETVGAMAVPTVSGDLQKMLEGLGYVEGD